MIYEPKSEMLHILRLRGFLSDCTDLIALDEKLQTGKITGYAGYDATAPSLHVGHLMNIRVLRLLQKFGGKPIVVMGGGTTQVGDPSFRNTERPLLKQETIAANIASIAKVFDSQIDFSGSSAAIMLNNASWLDQINHLEFMRDIGRHFTVSRMLSFDSVKGRLEDGGSLSFFEFGYMILQAYDFLALNAQYGCTLQIGGSDQWGNIINGIDLIRKMNGGKAIGLITPLLTNSAGKKMGKSANGAVWLDGDMLSPWDFWQFWRNVDDADVGRFLKLFTDLEVEECDRLGAAAGSEINQSKIVLANLVTASIHGDGAAASAAETARNLFSGGMAQGDIPTYGLPQNSVDTTIAKLLVLTGLAQSGKDAKRKLQDGAVRVAGVKIVDPAHLINAGRGPVHVSVSRKQNVLVIT